MSRIVLYLAALLLMPLAALPATDEIATAPVLPPTHRGLYAIWYERMPEISPFTWWKSPANNIHPCQDLITC
jgi:hypothetical protein